jgi:hypothetical protein
MPLAQLDGGIFDLKQNGSLVGKVFTLKLGGSSPPNTYVEQWVTLSTFNRAATFMVEAVTQSATYQDFKNYLASTQGASVQTSTRYVG